MEKVIGALGEAFMAQNKGVTFTYNPTGSGSGITAVGEGRCDIGLSSRALKDDEKASGLKETVLALDGIAVIVNPANPVSDLDVETIAKIYTGEITNWKEVGGNDAEIVLIGREAGSGTRDGFESITDTKDSCKYRQELTSTGDVITTVSTNPDAIGYASLAALKDNVKALTVGGIAPTEDTVKDGSYVIQRPFVLVTKDGAELSTAAQAFFDYATSADAADLIALPRAAGLAAEHEDDRHESNSDQDAGNDAGFKQRCDRRAARDAVDNIQQSWRDQRADDGHGADKTGRKGILIAVLEHFRIYRGAQERSFRICHAEYAAEQQANDSAHICDAAADASDYGAAEVHQPVNIARQSHQLTGKDKHRDCHKAVIVGRSEQLLRDSGKIRRPHAYETRRAYKAEDIAYRHAHYHRDDKGYYKYHVCPPYASISCGGRVSSAVCLGTKMCMIPRISVMRSSHIVNGRHHHTYLTGICSAELVWFWMTGLKKSLVP